MAEIVLFLSKLKVTILGYHLPGATFLLLFNSSEVAKKPREAFDKGTNASATQAKCAYIADGLLHEWLQFLIHAQWAPAGLSGWEYCNVVKGTAFIYGFTFIIIICKLSLLSKVSKIWIKFQIYYFSVTCP